jgi:6-phosphogluconolactonase
VTRLTTLPDSRAAAEHAAREIAAALHEAVARRGVAHLALAGGHTPRPAYELLARLVDDWSAIELWYGDERCVGPEDPESNHRLVADSLLAHIPGSALGRPLEHRIAGELGAEAAAVAYAAELRARVATSGMSGASGASDTNRASETSGASGASDTNRASEVSETSGTSGASGASETNRTSGASGPPVLDVALLGIGEDGHTASLFPGDPAVEDSSGALCLPVHNSPKPPPDRVTCSLPVLRAARISLLLVAGSNKADALAAVLAGRPDPRVPATLLVSERLHIVADAAAARIDPSDSSNTG